MKTFEFNFWRSARTHGGLFFGISWHYPISMISNEFDWEYDSTWINIGLVFCQLKIAYNYNKACIAVK